MVWGKAVGYITAKSEWLDVSDNEPASTSVALTPASIVRFELSEQQKQRITEETAYLRCRVINLAAKESEPVGPYGEEEISILLSTNDAANYREPILTLPAGRYEIRYKLYQDKKGYMTYTSQTPLLTGTTQVELLKRETRVITISQ